MEVISLRKVLQIDFKNLYQLLILQRQQWFQKQSNQGRALKVCQQVALKQQPIQLRTLSLPILQYLYKKKFIFSDIPNETRLLQLPSLQQELNSLCQRMNCHHSILLLKFDNKNQLQLPFTSFFCNNSGNKIRVSWDPLDSNKEFRISFRVCLSTNVQWYTVEIWLQIKTL